MRNFGMRRLKAILLTIFSFGFCFVLILNLMVHQLNNSDHDVSNSASASHPAYRMGVRQLSQQRENYAHAAHVQWMDRKPQAANEKNLGDSNPGPDSKQDDVVKIQNKPVAVKKVDTFLFPNRRKTDEDYTYEEDIEKVVIQDEPETSDEKDEDDVDPDEDYDEDENENSNIFDKSNNASFTKPPLHYQEIHGTTTLSSFMLHPLVVNGIFWSPQVEQLIPKGLSNTSLIGWVRTKRGLKVKSVQPPSWDRCGRPKNGYVVMEDGSALCARYRHPHDKLVLGEVMSFYLSVLLGMDNVPAVLLSQVDPNSTHWHGHTRDTTLLGWGQGQYVALIQWIDNMNSQSAHVKMPELILEAYHTGSVVNSDSIREANLSKTAVMELLQWGSMLIFDYLTGNYDRVASMQDAAEKENLPKIIQENIRNLRKSTGTGKLWLIDNESGLLDAYDLLFHSGKNGDRFLRFHKEMLQTMCIFELPLVNSLNALHGSINPSDVLENFARKYEPLLDNIQKDITYNLFKTNFPKRLAEVIRWVTFCQDSHKR